MSARLLLLLLALSVAACTPNLGNDDDDATGDDDDATGDDDDATGDDDDATGDDDDSTTDPGDDDDSTTDPGDDDDDTPGEVNPVLLCESIAAPTFQVLEWSIDGDWLTATFQYSGGCEVHDFQLCWDGLFMESFPVQVALTPQDYGPPDPCEAEITETHTFELYPLRDAWIDAYGNPPGEIIVNMSSASESYTF